MYTNGYDETKKMLELVRNFKQEDESFPVDDSGEDSGVNTTTLTDAELDDEMNSFKEAVGGVASFEKFVVMEGNIQWSGRLDNENISWTFSLDRNDGCIISSEGTVLTDETVERILKLKNYFNTWSQYWSNEVNG